jgi:hypothetical protein
MTSDLPARDPGLALPVTVRASAVRAARKRKPVDPRILKRVRDALARLPDSRPYEARPH